MGFILDINESDEKSSRTKMSFQACLSSCKRFHFTLEVYSYR